MEVLYSARRLGMETSLKWLVYDDWDFKNEAITMDGQRIEVKPWEVNSYYRSLDDKPIDIRVTAKANASTHHEYQRKQAEKETEKVEDVKTEEPPKPTKSKKTDKKAKKAKPPQQVEDKTSNDALSYDYHKVIYRLKGEGFVMDVDGSYDDAVKLKNELSKGKHIDIVEVTIRPKSVVVDSYYILVHKRNGKIISDIDFDNVDDAKRHKDKIKTKYLQDMVLIYPVEESIKNQK